MFEPGLVSIILAVYNGEKYLYEAIDSVLRQDYPDFELLIINDGSKDNSDAVIRSFADPRIKYFVQENRGVSAARNVGLKAMQGEFFCFLDADDMMTLRSISSRVKIFQENPKVHFVEGRVVLMDVDMKNIIRTYSPSFRGEPLHELITISGKCFFSATWMFRRLASVEYRFQEGLTHGEDLLFCIRYARQGLYDYTNEEILLYRTGNQSAMSNLNGLEKGYHDIYKELKNDTSIPGKWVGIFKRKIMRIMFLSYLKSGKPVKAFVTLIKYAKS